MKKFFVYSMDNGSNFAIGQLVDGIHCDMNGRELSSMCNYIDCTYHTSYEGAEKELENINPLDWGVFLFDSKVAVRQYCAPYTGPSSLLKSFASSLDAENYAYEIREEYA